MSRIEVAPHQITLRMHRDGTFTIKGLNASDLGLLHGAVDLMREQAVVSPGDEWWQDAKAWATAWRDFMNKVLEINPNYQRTAELEAELPWVDR